MRYGSSYRRRTFDRMVRALESGTPPNRISGDRDILQYALEHVQRQADIADDLPCPHADVDERGVCLLCGGWTRYE